MLVQKQRGVLGNEHGQLDHFFILHDPVGLEEFDEKVQNELAGGTTGHHVCYSAQEREE